MLSRSEASRLEEPGNDEILRFAQADQGVALRMAEGAVARVSVQRHGVATSVRRLTTPPSAAIYNHMIMKGGGYAT
jgi:hypothetical protein